MHELRTELLQALELHETDIEDDDFFTEVCAAVGLMEVEVRDRMLARLAVHYLRQ